MIDQTKHFSFKIHLNGGTWSSGFSSVTFMVLPGKHERKWSNDKKVSLKSNVEIWLGIFE